MNKFERACMFVKVNELNSSMFLLRAMNAYNRLLFGRHFLCYVRLCFIFDTD